MGVMPRTLTDLLESTAAARPDGPAFHGGPTWSGMAAAVRRMAGGLARAGIGPGDRVAVFLPNRPDFLVLLFALARRGATAVLLNTRFRAAEIGNLLARAAPVAIAVARDFPTVDAAALLAELPEAQRASLRLQRWVPTHPEASIASTAIPSHWLSRPSQISSGAGMPRAGSAGWIDASSSLQSASAAMPPPHEVKPSPSASLAGPSSTRPSVSSSTPLQISRLRQNPSTQTWPSSRVRCWPSWPRWAPAAWCSVRATTSWPPWPATARCGPTDA